jgi:hypothetical protein
MLRITYVNGPKFLTSIRTENRGQQQPKRETRRWENVAFRPLLAKIVYRKQSHRFPHRDAENEFFPLADGACALT